MEIKKLKIQNLFLLIPISLLLVLFNGSPINAAELYIQIPDSKFQIPSVGVGDQFQVDLFLNTEGENINAIEGKIIFPEQILTLKEISDGNSIINFWLERPSLKSTSNIPFSGIIPGGYLNKNGLLFSIIFQAKQEGNGKIEINDAKILLNDGLGTATKVKIINSELRITKSTGQAPALQIQPVADTFPPEDFKIDLTQNENIFDGQWFIAFSTQDKGSGLDHYEVCEGGKKCVITESPYLLTNQKIDREIVVKAIDKNGNERISLLPAPKARPWYKNSRISAIILLIGLAFVIGFILRKLLWRKSSTRY